MQRSPTPTKRHRKRAARVYDEELRARFLARIEKLLMAPAHEREGNLGEWSSFERAAVALSIGFPGHTVEQYANGAIVVAGLVRTTPSLSEAAVVESFLDLTDNPVGALLYYNLPPHLCAMLAPFLTPAAPLQGAVMGPGLTLTDLGLEHLKVPWPEAFEIESEPDDSSDESAAAS
jgi:hypothetical protein